MIIIFDIGGTKTRVSKVIDSQSFDTPIVYETPQEYEVGFQKLVEAIQSLSSGESIEKIIGGIAGAIDRTNGQLLRVPHIKDWEGKNMQNDLSEKFSCNVRIENDAVLAGLGEAHFGAGKGFDSVTYITISTGVGGARILHGKIDEGAINFEPGHQIIDVDSTLVPNSSNLDFEGLVSGSAIESRYQKKPSEITDDAFWDEEARLVAFGLHNTIVHWTPDVLILGGSMMRPIGISIENVKKHLAAIPNPFPQLPILKQSELGDFSGLYGGLALAFEQT